MAISHLIAGGAPYYLGPGLLRSVGTIAGRWSNARFPVIVTSPAVERLFGDRVSKSFGGKAARLLMDDREANKSFETVDRLVGELLSIGARRDTVIVALGGGVIGDTAGFAASIFMRGVDLIHVPTTLLAQVDSSIGGKVAVNHARGKNLVGSFYRPRAIVADLETLATLGRRDLVSGLYEIVKAGVIADRSLFEMLESAPDALLAGHPAALEPAIRLAAGIKGRVVEADEREGGLRRVLNYGHTIGHGIEAALDYEGISHGEAVAWGMIGANAIAVRRGMLEEALRQRIDALILAYEPGRPPVMERGRVLAAITHDKKFVVERRVMVLPGEIGRAEIIEDITDDEIAFGVDVALERMAQ
ncbi:MAG TPA: 3-dehydroquinate synthase [Thermoanaerobaculia bacterium]|nr:3-dehydroquinate synthase [Thermoanaerobaculia bacterium]